MRVATRAIYASFLLALVVPAYYVNRAFQVSHARQVASCERGNAIREELNRRSASLRLEKAIIAQFLTDATDRRGLSEKPADRALVVRYEALSTRLARVRYRDIPVADCTAAVDHAR